MVVLLVSSTPEHEVQALLLCSVYGGYTIAVHRLSWAVRSAQNYTCTWT